MFRNFRVVKTAVCLFAVAPLAAASMLFSTPSGSNISGTGNVSAQANFTFTNGSLTITLKNSQADEQNAGQLLAGLEFSVSGVTNGFSLGSSSGNLITVTGPGSGTPGSTGVSTGWGFGTNSGAIIVCEICPGSAMLSTPVTGGPPSHTIIGPGPFTNPNASLTGNHNPFFDQSVTFVVSDASFTPSSTISSAAFRFGTNAAQAPLPGSPASTVPEPAGLFLTGAGLFGIGFTRRRFAKR